MRTASRKEAQKIIFLAGSPLNSKKDVVNLSLVAFFSDGDSETSIFHGAYTLHHDHR